LLIIIPNDFGVTEAIAAARNQWCELSKAQIYVAVGPRSKELVKLRKGESKRQ
jgi:hypothetical protein